MFEVAGGGRIPMADSYLNSYWARQIKRNIAYCLVDRRKCRFMQFWKDVNFQHRVNMSTLCA